MNTDFDKLKGHTFGSLVFIRKLPQDECIVKDKFRTVVELLCVCGMKTIADWNNVKNGKTKSCGCLRTPYKYGKDKMQLYKVWTGLKQRCYNPKNSAFKWYGARGVSMCDEWRYDYNKFFEWSMSNGWEKGLDIDKDIKGDGMMYSPENCSFVSHKVNMEAVRWNKVSKELAQEIKSSPKSARQLAKEFELSRNTVNKIRGNKYFKDDKVQNK